MARSLNRAQLIGNLTRDPELRYTPSGTAVCSFGLATNRTWTTDTGEKREETEFHRIVAWNKLAELCSQFLVKGRKVFVEGRLTTRSWTAQDGSQRSSTEIIIDDMILLDSRRPGEEHASTAAVKPDEVHEEVKDQEQQQPTAEKEKKPKKATEVKETKVAEVEEEVVPDDIPF